jgi:hypothetical protein
MTNKPVYTKVKAAQLRAEQRLIDKVTNMLAQKRRNDAEDRAAQKAMADD